MKYKPEQKHSKLLNTVMICLLIAGTVAYSLPVIFRSNEINISPFPFTALAIMCFIAAIFLLIRYRMSSFEYIIRPRSDLDPELAAAYSVGNDISRFPYDCLDFIVYKSQSSKPGAMECVLSVSDLIAAYSLNDKKSKSEMNSKYSKDGFVFYNYTLTFRPDSVTEFIFIDGNRYVGIILEDDNEVTRFLHNALENKKR